MQYTYQTISLVLIWSGVKPLLWQSLMGDEEEKEITLNFTLKKLLKPVSSHFNGPLILIHVNIIY